MVCPHVQALYLRRKTLFNHIRTTAQFPRPLSVDDGPTALLFVKPTNGQEGGFVVGAGGKFDVYCAGLLVLQMCFAPLRGPNGVKRFKAAIVNYDYDLAAWRESVEGTKGYEEGVEILDKNGGADASLTPTQKPP